MSQKKIPKKLHIFVNKKCNMSCKFCYWKEHPNEEMSDGIADKIIEYVKKNPSKYDYIVFFGGEPLLSQGLVLKFIKEIGYDMKYIIMTNGTISPKNFLDKLYSGNKKRYNLCFTVSYEGLSQDIRKEKTKQIIECNIKKIQNYEPKVLCTLASVMSPYNYKNIEKNIIHFYKIADSAIFMRICDLANNWKDDELDDHIADYPKFVDILTYYDVVKEKNVIMANRIDRAMETEGDNRNGTKAFFCHKMLNYTDIVGTDGKKYLCEPAFANETNCLGYLWSNKPTKTIKHNKTYKGVNHHYCLLYDSCSLKYDKAMDKMRIKYQERKKKLQNLKYSKRN